MQMENIVFRPATKEEYAILCQLRKIQLIDEGMTPNKKIDQTLEHFFQSFFANGNLYQIIALVENTPIATGAVCFYDYPPSYTNPTGVVAYIANMYTASNYRGHGIATHILGLLMEEIKRRKVTKIRLLASKQGMPVYQKYGFSPENGWMQLQLKDEFGCL